MLAMTNPGQDYIQSPGLWTQAGLADQHKHPVFLLFEVLFKQEFDRHWMNEAYPEKDK